MYLSTYQIDCIFNCYKEKYANVKTEEEIEKMAESEVCTIEDSNDYKRASAFMEKAKKIPTNGMTKDLEILNNFREYKALAEKTEFVPINREDYKFKRAELEKLLKDNRVVIRGHQSLTPRQKEVLVNMGINPEIIHLIPRSKYEEIYNTLKDINVTNWDEEHKRDSWLFAEGERREKDEELEF